MKRLLRCAKAAAILCGIATLVSLWKLDGPLTFIIWPGLVTVGTVYDRFGFYWDHSKSVLLLLLPGLIVNIVLYTGLFVAVAKIWSLTDPLRPVESPRKK